MANGNNRGSGGEAKLSRTSSHFLNRVFICSVPLVFSSIALMKIAFFLEQINLYFTFITMKKKRLEEGRLLTGCVARYCE
jgi:hypothetical protein